MCMTCFSSAKVLIFAVSFRTLVSFMWIFKTHPLFLHTFYTVKMRFTTKRRDLSRNIQRKKVYINENKLKSWLRFVGISTYVLYEQCVYMNWKENARCFARTHSYVQKFKIVEHFIFASDLIRNAVCTDTQFYLFYVTLRQHYAFIAIARVNYISHICLYRAQNVVLSFSLFHHFNIQTPISFANN